MRYKQARDCPPSMLELLQKQGVTLGRDCARSAPVRRRSKYGNVRTKFNGEVFDSKAEARDDQMLRMQEAAGEIAGYAHHVSIPLRARRGTRMEMDWLINEPRPHACEACGHVDFVPVLVLKDTKTRATHTRAWETKRRILEAQLGVKIELIQH